MRPAVVLSINSSWNVVNFRQALVRALQDHGFSVVAMTPADADAAKLAEMGVEHVPIAIDSASLSPVKDLALLASYRRHLEAIQPVAFLGYTAKPNIWGSLAAQSLSIPVINNISGLGTAFIEGGWLRWIVARLYRIALRRASVVFFQNPDDRDLFLELSLVDDQQARLLPGSGIDLQQFQPEAEPPEEGRDFTFLLAGRLLWQKGVEEFVEAARAVKSIAPDTEFCLLGFLDSANRSAVDQASIDRWREEGLIEYLGASDDVRPFFARADCIVLPSYREGLPRVLLEGAAMGKPLIATDVPGCRQAVEHRVNGLLCAARDAGALAEAMLAMKRLQDEERRAMGAAGRAKVEREFGEAAVIQAYLTAIEATIRR